MSLLEYAKQSELPLSAISTIEVLIDHVAWRFDDHDYGQAARRNQERRQPGYVPHFSLVDLEQAIPHLMKLDRLNLHSEKLRDLTPIGFLPQLTTLTTIAVHEQQLRQFLQA